MINTKIFVLLLLISTQNIFPQYVKNFTETLEMNGGRIVSVNSEHGWVHTDIYKVIYNDAEYTFETVHSNEGIHINDIPEPLLKLFPAEHNQQIEIEKENETFRENLSDGIIIALILFGILITIAISVGFYLDFRK